MADFFRPEARAVIWRWRDVIVACCIMTLGLWWAWGSFGILRWLGAALTVFGAVLIFTGFQRARFRQGAGGPGVVQLDERRLSYFGPLSGGMIALEDISKLEFDPFGHPAPHWVVTGPELAQIAIPTTAEGAEALFDVFAGLPGIRTEALLTVLSRTPDTRVVIWERVRPLLQ